MHRREKKKTKCVDEYCIALMTFISFNSKETWYTIDQVIMS